MLARRSGDRWYATAVNASDEPVKVNVEDVLEAVGVHPSWISLISGGNRPERKTVKAGSSHVIDTNDGLLLMF